MFQRIRIREFEIGLRFRDDAFVGLMPPGRFWIFDPFGRVRVDVVSRRAPWLMHDQLDLIIKSGALEGQAVVVDLKDHERGLVWVDGRFSHILPPGQFAYWTAYRKVEVEIIDARSIRFTHADWPVIVKSLMADKTLEVIAIAPGQVGVYYRDGQYVETLSAGRYAFWKGVADVKVVPVETRETILDIGGQDIMTADKVSLRLNALTTYRIADARLSLSSVDNVTAALYRETQLMLRALVGLRELDAILADKDGLAQELDKGLRGRMAAMGVDLIQVGIRDVILPGDMKDLFNKVTEAKKVAEANLIARREETAAIRSQANSAKLLQDNPMLVRLRELETLEKIAASSKLNVLLGEKGLAERVVNML